MKKFANGPVKVLAHTTVRMLILALSLTSMGNLLAFALPLLQATGLLISGAALLFGQVPSSSCCYFKCNTVDENFRGLGIGKKLLQLAIEAAKKQGAKAGISHLWKQSPNNSAVNYFTRCGGQHVASHAGKWNEESKQGYDCILCGFDCQCEAAEMIIYFD